MKASYGMNQGKYDYRRHLSDIAAEREAFESRSTIARRDIESSYREAIEELKGRTEWTGGDTMKRKAYVFGSDDRYWLYADATATIPIVVTEERQHEMYDAFHRYCLPMNQYGDYIIPANGIEIEI